MACRGESTCLCGLETSEASVNAKRKCKKTELKMIRNSFIPIIDIHKNHIVVFQ